MNIYFCPGCGRNFDGSECIGQDNLPRCPECDSVRVKLRGRVLVAYGLVILFVSTQIFPPFVPVAGILLGGSLCVMGMYRALRHFRATQTHSDAGLDLYESQEDEDDLEDEELR